jgi:dTDP-4-dehydrorhamnose reductase
MKVFVLGHRGMLGHVVAAFLTEAGFEVVTSFQRYFGLPRDPLVETVRDSGCEWVVNALGRIKQKSADAAELFRLNAQFPVHLKARLRPGQRLLHASTDCVFSGRRGQYRVVDEPDAEDPYGFSKLLGEAVAEAPRCLVVRTSIIGPEANTSFGLMGWLLAQRGVVPGYLNHRWNGVTTLEWAKVCSEVLLGKLPSGHGIIQVASRSALSKFELLKMIAAVWEHPVTVTPLHASDTIDRTLEADVVRPELEVQLRELKAWYSGLRTSQPRYADSPNVSMRPDCRCPSYPSDLAQESVGA